MIRYRHSLIVWVGLAMFLLTPLKVGRWATASGSGQGMGRLFAAEVRLAWAEGAAAAEATEAGQDAPTEAALKSAVAGNWDAAVSGVTEGVAADWKNAEAWKTAAAVLREAQKQGREEVAQRIATTLRQQAGNDARKQRQIGAALREAGFFGPALSLYEELVKKDPLDAVTLAGLAETRLAMGEVEAAQAAADRSVGANGNCAEGHRARAKALLARGFPQVALEALDQAAKSEPNRADVLGVRAQAYLLLDNEAPAEGLIEKALQSNPEEPEALFALGLLQSRRGEKAEAQKTWQQYLKVDPASARARRIRWGVVVVAERRVSPEGLYTFPAWSPDGKKIAVCAGGWGGDLQVLSADGSAEPVVVATGAPAKQFPSWSRDSSKLVYSELGQTTPDGSPLGAQLFVQDAAPGAVPRRLAETFQVAEGGRWNPVQDTIVFRGCQTQGDTSLLYLIHPDGSGLVTVPGSRTLPSHMPNVNWSPDGSRIVSVQIARMEPKTIRLFTMDVREIPAPQTLLEEPGMHVHPAFSPDGDKVLFTSDRGGAPGVWNIWVTSVSEGGRPLLLLPLAQTFQPAAEWSPDGDAIAYCYGGGEPGVYIATLAGLRTILQLDLPRGSVVEAVEGREAEKPLTITLRNLTPEDQETTLQVQITPEVAAGVPPAHLTVPGKAAVEHTVTVRPGRRGEYRAIVTATGSEFEVQRETTFRVIEGWNEKKRVVVLPFFDVWNAEADPHAVGASVWRMVMEKLYRLWQFRVANVRSPSDWSALMGSESGLAFMVEERDGQRIRRLIRPKGAMPLVATDEASAALIAQSCSTSDYVVCGTVTADPQSVQAHLTLVDVSTGKLLPGPAIETQRPRDQLPSLAGDLAKRLCEALTVPLEPDQSAWLDQPMAANAEALEAYGRAVVFSLSGDEKEATAWLLRSLAADPQFALGHREFVAVLQRSGKRREALTEWKIATTLDPADALALSDLLEEGYYGGEAPDRVKTAETVLTLDPYNPAALRALGGRLENYEQAEALLRRSLLDPYQPAQVRQATENFLGTLYAKAPRLDPRLRVPVELPKEPTEVKALAALLSKASGVPLAVIAPGMGEKQVTLDEAETTVGQAMEAMARAVEGRWDRTEAGYFLTEGEASP